MDAWLNPLVPVLGLTAAGALMALVMVLSRKGRTEDEARAYLAGFRYVLSDDPDAAIAELARAAQLNTQTLETYFALGALFRRKGDLDRAIRLHQNMLLRPGLAPEVRRRALIALAMDYRRSGLSGRGQQELEKVLSEEPGQREALVQLRQIHEDAGQWEEAAELQARLVELDGQGQAILAHHLAEHSRPKRSSAPDEALAEARRAAEICPASADAQLALGEALLALSRAAEAREALVKAVDLEPELLPKALRPLGQAMGAGELEALLRERAAPGGARTAPYELALAVHLRERGEADRAIAHLRAVVERKPRLWEARKELGALLLAHNRSEEVRTEYAELLGALGQPPLGFVCRECGQKLLEHAFRCPACYAWDAVGREDSGAVRRI